MPIPKKWPSTSSSRRRGRRKRRKTRKRRIRRRRRRRRRRWMEGRNMYTGWERGRKRERETGKGENEERLQIQGECRTERGQDGGRSLRHRTPGGHWSFIKPTAGFIDTKTSPITVSFSRASRKITNTYNAALSRLHSTVPQPCAGPSKSANSIVNARWMLPELGKNWVTLASTRLRRHRPPPLITRPSPC